VRGILFRAMKDPAGTDADLDSAVCAGCGCLCDDVAVRFRGHEAVEVERACTTGEAWLRSLGPLATCAQLRGKAASIDDAIDAAVKQISGSRAPAVLGLHGLTVEAMREAVALARTIEAPLFPCPSISGAALRSGIDAPECTATLGEVRNTADLILFWRADPDRTHPRHLERYSFEPPLLGGGKRVLVVAGAGADNVTARRAAETISLPAEEARFEADLMVVRGLRLLLERGTDPHLDARAAQATASLRRRIEASRHAHIFLGGGAASSPALWNAFNLLAARAREKHRITISALPAPGNLRGALEVLTWSTGSARPLTTSERLLENDGADLILALGMDPTALPAETRKGYDRAQRVVVSGIDDPAAAVAIRVPGLDPRLAATVARSDGILLTLDGRSASAASRTDPAVGVIAKLRAGVAARRAR
jgi:formylmethanofuran dehydrogenase subunit B